MIEIRLQKFISECGIASRRKAEELIAEGKVSVNGIIVKEMGVKITEEDKVEVNGRPICLETKKIYIMLNKPTGVVTTSNDQFARKTVLDLISGIEERVYPVGRLDYDTSGLLMLTNDGDFTYRITHPSHKIKKTYIAVVKGEPSKEVLGEFRRGLEIEEDFVTSPSEIKVLEKRESNSLVEIIIHEGKNRQIRKMCEVIGHPVITLMREAIGELKLGDLPVGRWRYMTQEEIMKVK